MLPLDVKKEVEALNALRIALESIHKAALELLEETRRCIGKCVACGKEVNHEGDEYCEICFTEWITQKMQEERHPDQK